MLVASFNGLYCYITHYKCLFNDNHLHILWTHTHIISIFLTILYWRRHSLIYKKFSLEKDWKNFCSALVTYFIVGNLYKTKGYLLWRFCVVFLTELCLYMSPPAIFNKYSPLTESQIKQHHLLSYILFLST